VIDIDRIVRSSNCLVKISGWLDKDIPLTKIFMFEELSPVPKGIRIDSLVFAIQEKAGFNLWWVEGEEAAERRLILPLESRGSFSFEGMGSLQSGSAKGIAIESFNITSTKTFLICIDMVKQ
jgi:hypothetical protein